MGTFSKLAKKAGRFVKKHRKSIELGARVVAAGITRGKSEKVVSQLKGVGAAVKTYKGLKKVATKAETALAEKIAKLAPPKVVPISAAPATTMPGGAPLRGVKRAPGVVAAKRPKAKRARVVKPRKMAAAKPRTAAGARRGPPKGGKDFKALSASWKKAGKPGTWLDWVKSH